MVVGGIGVGIAMVASLPLVAVVGVGVLAYATGAAISLARRRRPRGTERIDPFTVSETWRRYMRGALNAQARYDRAVGSVAPGPLRDRLEEIGRRVDQGVRECWRVAQRGDALDDAVSALAVPRPGDRLEAAHQDPGGADGDGADAVVRSLQAQVDTAERLTAVAGGAKQRLALLVARLDEAVAAAVELSMQLGSSTDSSGQLGSDVENLVEDLATLRSALEETEAVGE